MSTRWERLIRFISANDGSTKWGEPILPEVDVNLEKLFSEGRLRAKILAGDDFLSAKPTGEEDQVRKVLGPLRREDVSVVRCVGINYMSHIRELGFETPTNPTMFFKSPWTIADAHQSIPIPKLGQSHLDYEGELTIVIGRTGKNISEADALDYVAGYVASNDISCRDWQMDKDKAGYDQQWCFSKSFDDYAPLGPQIVSPKILGDGSGLAIRTLVNGEVRQESNTSDFCFDVRRMVSFLSTGQTLEKGSLIMTGTPGGVALGMDPPKYVQDGDVVEVEIEGIGSVRNVMAFE